MTQWEGRMDELVSISDQAELAAHQHIHIRRALRSSLHRTRKDQATSKLW